MNRMLALLLALTITTPILAGCVGGDDDGSEASPQLATCVDQPTDTASPDEPFQVPDPISEGIGYATDQDSTLLRWTRHLETSEYIVERRTPGGTFQEIDRITPASSTTELEALLDGTDPRWTDLSTRLMANLSAQPYEADTLPKLLNVLETDDALGQILSQRYYPVALATGHGYLDEQGQGSATYEYRVSAVTQGTTEPVGTVTVQTGQTTPLDAPESLTCLSLEPGSSLRAGLLASHGERQADRLLHLNVLLRWEGADRANASEPSAWTNGYDIFRAEVPTTVPSDLSQIGFTRVNGEAPVQPTPSYEPASDLDAPPPSTDQGYEPRDFYFIDETPAASDYIYIVVGRDLLGNVRDPVQQFSQFSPPVQATSHDLDPPSPPTALNATPTDGNQAVRVVWNHPEAPVDGAELDTSLLAREALGPQATNPGQLGDHGPDPENLGAIESMSFSGAQLSSHRPVLPADAQADHFEVWRTLNHSAERGNFSCADETTCWRHLGNATVPGFLDTDNETESVRWYMVRAADAGANPTPWVGPVQASLHDLEAPEPPELVQVQEPGAHPQDHTSLQVGAPTGDTDTTLVRVYCRFPPSDDWVRVTETRPGDFVTLSDHYQPPVDVQDAECKARSVDAHGNVGKASGLVTVDWLGTGETVPLPPPIITSVRHVAIPSSQGSGQGSGQQSNQQGGPELWSESGPSTNAPGSGPQATVEVPAIQINWTYPDLDRVDHFEVVRVDTTTATETSFELLPDVRQLEDRGTLPGHDYEYRVVAVPDVGEEASSLPKTTTLAITRAAQDLDRGQRPLEELFVTSVLHDPMRNETRIAWGASAPQKEELYAVFRSVDRDDGYIQITPVHARQTEDGEDQGMPASQYTDQNVTRTDYWYVVVGFDGRTGEPVSASPPTPVYGAESRDPADEPIDWTLSPLKLGYTVWNDACTGGLANTGAQATDLHWGSGYVTTGTTFSDTSQDQAEGRTWLEGADSTGTSSIEVPFQGLGIRATDGGNTVCSGSATVPGVTWGGDRHNWTTAAGLTARLHNITLGPAAAETLADVSLELPATMRYRDDQHDGRWLPLSNVPLAADGTFSATFDLDAMGQTCEDPQFSFPLETLPVALVPTGNMTVADTGISLETSCLIYDDPYDRFQEDLVLPPRPTNLSPTFGGQQLESLGDANDGFLRTTYNATQGITIDATGVDGTFQSDHEEGPLRWLASAPYGFQFQVDGPVSFTLQDGRIDSGQLGQGHIDFWHHRTAAGASRSPVTTVPFQQIPLAGDGDGYTTVQLDDTIDWDSTLSLAPRTWELLTGEVTFDDHPGKDLTDASTDHALEVPPFGTTYPEPGLNLRQAPTTLDWACGYPGQPQLDAAIDAYLRHGGMNDVFRALLQQDMALSIHGYDGLLSVWGRSYLDNHRIVAETAGEIALAYPTDLVLDMDPMSLDADGCIGGGPGVGDVQFDYWKLNVTLDALEFRDLPAGFSSPQATPMDKMLWGLGSNEVPHLSLPGGTPGTVLDTEYAFLPNGTLHAARFLYDAPTYEVDGYPYLLSDFRLSDLGERPGWEPDANLATPPDASSSGFWNGQTGQGFLELRGRLMTPYFGPLVTGAETVPSLRFTTDDPYLGFSQMPRVEKLWVDLAEVQVVWGYDVLYVPEPDGSPGIFTAFESYEFVPVGLLDQILKKPRHLVDAAFDETEGFVRDQMETARTAVDDAFQEIQATQNGAIGTARTELTAGIRGAETALDDELKIAFQNIRAEINDTAGTGHGVGAASDQIQDTEQDLVSVGASAAQLIADMRALKDTHLDPVAGTLEDARDELDRFQRQLEDARRTLGAIKAQVDRADDYVAGGAEVPITIPLSLNLSQEHVDAELRAEFGTTISIPSNGAQVAVLDKIIEIQTIVNAVHGDVDSAIVDIDLALQEIDDGLAQLQLTLAGLDHAIEQVATLGEQVVGAYTDALSTITDGLPQDDADMTAGLAWDLRNLTHDLEGQIRGELSTLADELVQELDQPLATLDQQLTAAIDQVKQQVQAGLDTVTQQVLAKLDEVRALIVVYLTMLEAEVRELLGPLRMLYLDTAPVISQASLATFLGLSSGTAALRSIAETRGMGQATYDTAFGANVTAWAGRLGVSTSEKPYDDLLEATWSEYTGTLAWEDTTQAIDTFEQANPEDPLLTTERFGGGTSGLLKDPGQVDISRTRGDVVVSQVANGTDWQFDLFRMRAKVTVGEVEEPTLNADVIGFNVSRHGQFLLFGQGLQSTILADSDTSVDATLNINFSAPRFEGGLTIYELDLQPDGGGGTGVYIAEASAAMGVGTNLLYLGVQFDGEFKGGSTSIGAGGTFLVGLIDPESEVLKAHFPEVLSKVKDIQPPGQEPSATLRFYGMYLRAHADIPVEKLIGIEAGCMLSLNVGARIGMWFFLEQVQDPQASGRVSFGALFGGYATGEVLCAISGRGEFLLEYGYQGGTHTVSGEGWLATGVGSCEPKTWKNWQKKWWGDDWCEQAAARATLTYSSQSDTWSHGIEAYSESF